jgi:integrase
MAIERTERVALTDRKLRALRPAQAGKRYELRDIEVSGLRMRVTDRADVNGKPQRTFVLLARYPGSKNKYPTRCALGEYPTLELAAARDKARKWRDLLRRGIDPRDEERRLQQEEERRRRSEAENTFSAVAETFLQRHVKGQRQAAETERSIRRELIGPWGDRPLGSITRRDVIALVEAIVDRDAPALARNVLGHCKTFFSWCVARDLLENSPAALVEASKIIGEKKIRQRVLNDDELRAFWRATEQLPYPFGPFYRFLLLTGVRKTEAAEARWREFDLGLRQWTIPPERFKSGVAHLVPLTPAVMSIVNELPRFGGDDYLFSTRLGSRPIGGFSKAKKRLDELTGIAPWVVHDLRRTVRTRMASLKVPDPIAEMVLGHGRRGLQRVYDHHSYESEVREALELWAAKLRDIVEPPPANVTHIKKAKTRARA